MTENGFTEDQRRFHAACAVEIGAAEVAESVECHRSVVEQWKHEFGFTVFPRTESAPTDVNFMRSLADETLPKLEDVLWEAYCSDDHYLARAALSHPHSPVELLEHALQAYRYEGDERFALSCNPNAPACLLRQAYYDELAALRELEERNGRLDKRDFTDVNCILAHPGAPPDVIADALDPEEMCTDDAGLYDTHIKASALRSRHVSVSRRERAMRDRCGAVRWEAVRNAADPVSSAALREIIFHDSMLTLRYAALCHPSSDRDDILEAACSPEVHELVRAAACANEKLAIGQLEQLLSSESDPIRAAIIRRPDMTRELLSRHCEFAGSSDDVRHAISQSPLITETEAKAALADETSFVRCGAVTNPHVPHRLITDSPDMNADEWGMFAQRADLTDEHIAVLLQHQEWFVRSDTIASQTLSKQHIETIMEDDDHMVVQSLAEHQKLDEKQIAALMAHAEVPVRQSVLHHQTVPAHIARAAFEDVPYVRHWALQAYEATPGDRKISDGPPFGAGSADSC